MYNIQRLLGYAKKLDKYPLHLQFKGKTLREIVNKTTNKIIKKETNKILIKKKNKIFLSFFSYNLLSLFLSFYIRRKIYYKVSNNVILKYKEKKQNRYKNLFRYDLIDIIYILKIILKFLKFILSNFLNKFKKNKSEIFDILVQYQNGNRKINKQDFPYLSNLMKVKKKFKIKYLISDSLNYNGLKGLKGIKYNYISTKKFKGLKHKPFYINDISKKSKKGILFCLKNYFSDPLILSIYLDFIMTYEYHFQLIKHHKVKTYINNNWDERIPAIRQAINDLSGTTLAFQNSYFNNKETAFLQHPTDIVFTWGKNSEKLLDSKENFIKKIVKIDPNNFSYKKKSKKRIIKIITIFDSSFNNDGFISPQMYNKFLKIILSKMQNSKNLYIQLKHKYFSFDKYIDKENLLLIEKLKKKNKFKSFKRSVSNNEIIAETDLVISIGTLSISAEALFKKVDSIVLCNNAIDKKFLKQINNIYPFAFYNLNEFEKNLNKKLDFDINILKIAKLKKFFFEENIKKTHPHQLISKLLSGNS